MKEGASVQNSLYYKVLYKITTDPQELAILEEALVSKVGTNSRKININMLY